MASVELRPQPLPQITAGDHPSVIIGCLFLLGLVFAWAGAKAFDIGAPAECRTAPIAFGKHAAITISVKSGMSCPVIVKTATASIDELEITSFPQDGTVLARGRTGLIYRSRQSFKGEDFIRVFGARQIRL